MAYVENLLLIIAACVDALADFADKLDAAFALGRLDESGSSGGGIRIGNADHVGGLGGAFRQPTHSIGDIAHRLAETVHVKRFRVMRDPRHPVP